MDYNKTGQIIKIISNLYTVEVANNTYDCKPRGKFRYTKITPVVGDYCLVDTQNNYILDILPRKNYLTRPVVANVDAAIIMTSLKEPALSLNLLDKLLMIITLKNIEPIICLSKIDLVDSSQLNQITKIFKYYTKIGIKVFQNTDIASLKKYLTNKTVVITGQTGAGKSTLINKLNPNLNLKTAAISKSLGRGKHTTRHVQLYKIADFYIVDTPGFSAIDFTQLTKNDIASGFIEFKNYTCRFNNCQHDKEIGCNVKKAVINNEILDSRYQNYLRFLNEARTKKWK